mmetsp:Transcript_124721/g.220989  ORF Transcript_124721/g.220989 Transcript_124721/m.220989 type:complete len:135 (+) Transcript_124721:107-511(+)
MAPAKIPKTCVPPEMWAKDLIYSAKDTSLALPDVSKLGGMSMTGPQSSTIASSTPELSAAIACMTETGDFTKCTTQLDALKVAGGYKEVEVKGSMAKAMDLSSKAGWKNIIPIGVVTGVVGFGPLAMTPMIRFL